MGHEYVSKADMIHTQLKTNWKNEEPLSETWKYLDDQGDCE